MRPAACPGARPEVRERLVGQRYATRFGLALGIVSSRCLTSRCSTLHFLISPGAPVTGSTR